MIEIELGELFRCARRPLRQRRQRRRRRSAQPTAKVSQSAERVLVSSSARNARPPGDSNCTRKRALAFGPIGLRRRKGQTRGVCVRGRRWAWRGQVRPPPPPGEPPEWARLHAKPLWLGARRAHASAACSISCSARNACVCLRCAVLHCVARGGRRARRANTIFQLAAACGLRDASPTT